MVDLRTETPDLAPEDTDAVVLFGGAGGWERGLRLVAPDLAARTLSVELDRWACATSRAAGHQVLRASVTQRDLPHRFGPLRLFVASPPCQTFSTAGKGAGRDAMAMLGAMVAAAAEGRDYGHLRRRIAHTLRADLLSRTTMTRAEASAHGWAAANGASLSVEPMRWVVATSPTIIAMEQVPAVLPLWSVYAHHLRAMGYRVWTGKLNSADFGVPQTRVRAFLMAHREMAPHPPEPTHARTPGPASLFGAAALPWVTMAEALGWPPSASVDVARGAGMIERHGPRPGRDADEPAPTIRAGSTAGGCGPNLRVSGLEPDSPRLRHPLDAPAWREEAGLDDAPAGLLVDRRQNGAPIVDPQAEPCPTVTGAAFGKSVWRIATGQNTSGTGERYERDGHEPAPTVTSRVDTWKRTSTYDPHALPAPTVTGGGPASGGPEPFPSAAVRAAIQAKAPTDHYRITLAEASVLQSFPWDFPWQGPRTAAFLQVGNAVPPRMGAHVFAALQLGPPPPPS